MPTRWWVADTDPNPHLCLYTRGNTGEVFPNAMTALTGTLIGAAAEAGQLAVFLDMGGLTAADLAGPSPGTGVFGGYLYSNLSLGRLLGYRVPGLKPEMFEEQVTGDITDLPPFTVGPGDRNPMASVRSLKLMPRLLRRPDLTPLERAATDAAAWVASMPDLDTASDDQLLAYLGQYPARFEASMERLLAMSLIAGGPRALADQLLARTKAGPGLANRALSGIDDIDSARPAIELWRLGRIVAGDPGLTASFDAGPADLEARVEATALAEPLREFLVRFGHRGADEYELASPSWGMDPPQVLAAIDRLRRAPADRDPAVAAARLRKDSIAAMAELDQGVPRPLRWLVRQTLAVAKDGAVGRERAKDILVLENSGARRAIAALAGRATTRGGPVDPRAIYFVTAEEIASFVADPGPFAAVIDARRERWEFLQARVPPMWFDGQIPDPATWPRRDDARARPPAPGAQLRGIGVAGGSATGRARVLTDPGDPRGLEAGDVLVCHITDPGWTPLFLAAAAVVCETGAQQSHAAIIARELGIPAVLSAVGITGVADGTMLTVDGDAGTVRIDP